MKLIIQIPCLNEEGTLPQTIADLPREVPGIAEVEFLVVDDGSTDRTVEVARECGVEHVVRLTNNKGLAAGFQAGLDACLKLGADVVVNTDADNQYRGADVAKLVAPIVAGEADMVVGDRQVSGIDHFSGSKKGLQRLGSWVVRRLSGTDVTDATSGFRAYNREAALQLLVVDNFTYTLESLIQAGKMLIAVDEVEVGTNPMTRESRLFASTGAYVRRNGPAILRIYARYEPLRAFATAGAVALLLAVCAWLPFLPDWLLNGDSTGHLQSLILGAVPFTYAYFLIASHTLSKPDYGQITVLWSAVFITISTLYRPVEQLLSRHVSERLAKGEPLRQELRVASTIQIGLALFFAVAALVLRGAIQDGLLEGSATLYWVFFGAVLFYAARFFARRVCAGQLTLGLFAALLLAVSVFRT